MTIDIDFLKTCRNNLKRLTLVKISSCIPFPFLATCSQRTPVSTDMAICNKNGPLFLGFSRRKCQCWLFKESPERAPFKFWQPIMAMMVPHHLNSFSQFTGHASIGKCIRCQWRLLTFTLFQWRYFGDVAILGNSQLSRIPYFRSFITLISHSVKSFNFVTQLLLTSL